MVQTQGNLAPCTPLCGCYPPPPSSASPTSTSLWQHTPNPDRCSNLPQCCQASKAIRAYLSKQLLGKLPAPAILIGGWGELMPSYPTLCQTGHGSRITQCLPVPDPFRILHILVTVCSPPCRTSQSQTIPWAPSYCRDEPAKLSMILHSFNAGPRHIPSQSS